MMVASRSAFAASSKLARKVRSVLGGAKHRRQRRLEIMRDRGQQRGAQPVRLDRALGAIHVLDETDALDGQRALIDQRVEQAALVRREQRARLVAVDADNADRAAAGAHRQEQPLRAGQRVRAAAGGRLFSQAHFAAAKSASSSISSGG